MEKNEVILHWYSTQGLNNAASVKKPKSVTLISRLLTSLNNSGSVCVASLVTKLRKNLQMTILKVCFRLVFLPEKRQWAISLLLSGVRPSGQKIFQETKCNAGQTKNPFLSLIKSDLTKKSVSLLVLMPPCYQTWLDKSSTQTVTVIQGIKSQSAAQLSSDVWLHYGIHQQQRAPSMKIPNWKLHVFYIPSADAHTELGRCMGFE